MNAVIISVLLFVVGLAAAYTLQPLIQKFLLTQQIVRNNFKNEQIPTAMGLVYVFALTVIFALATALLPMTMAADISDEIINCFELLLIAVLIIGFVGWLDDTQGDKVVKGFSGHFGKLLRNHEMTTGALKALSGGFIALFACLIIEGTVGERFINFFIVALMTNWINLLDLRPGRSVKFFLFIVFVLLLFVPTIEAYLIVVAPILGVVLYMFPGDLKAKFMVGDTGANILGVVAGILMASFSPMILKWFVLIFLVGGHIIAETYSVTKLIKKVAVLDWIDQLGRAKDKMQK